MPTLPTLTRVPGQSAMLPGAVIVNGFVFTSGLISPTALAALSTGADIPAERQIRETLEVLAATLTAAGTDVAHVVKVSAFIATADLFDTWNAALLEVWPEPGPARTTLVAGFPDPEVKFELEAVAAG